MTAVHQRPQERKKERNPVHRKFQRKRTVDLRILKNKLSGQVAGEIINWRNNGRDDKLRKLRTKDNSLSMSIKSMLRKSTYKMPPLKDGSSLALSAELKAEADSHTYS